MLLVAIVFFSLTSDQFLSMQNLLDLAESYAVTGIFALGLFVVLVTGDRYFVCCGGVGRAVPDRHAVHSVSI